MDTGSEILIINAATARQAQALRLRSIKETGEIHLADGTPSGRVSLPIETGGHHVEHTFHILPILESPMLIGIDL